MAEERVRYKIDAYEPVSLSEADEYCAALDYLGSRRADIVEGSQGYFYGHTLRSGLGNVRSAYEKSYCSVAANLATGG